MGDALAERQGMRALVYLRPRPTRLAVRLLLEACQEEWARKPWR
ncbi:hypothetical protein [Corallococcus sp. CA054B]|nr:hypothetical protein [Corallococcus sp. CA054B]